MGEVSIPAPVGGWNARDALAEMEATDAVELINWIPDNGVVRGRGGSSTQMTGLTSPVETLVAYEGRSSKRLLAAYNGTIVNVTNFASPVVLGSGFFLNRWQRAMFNNTMVLVNGLDAPQTYDGTTLTPLVVTPLATPVNLTFTPGTGTLTTGTYYYRVAAINATGTTLASTETSLAITGPAGVNVKWSPVLNATGYNIYGRATGAEQLIGSVDGFTEEFLDNGSATPSGALPSTNTSQVVASSLIGVTNFKGRAFYWQAATTSAWYAQAGSFQGYLTEIPLAYFFQRGGTIAQIITWTRDSGDGVDDYCVFLSTLGELLVYQGDDPGNSLRWSMVGRFQMGAPLGVRAHARFASTEIIITDDGFVGLDQAITNAQTELAQSFGGKIFRAAKAAAKAYRANFGWEAIFYPGGNLFLVNIPVTATQSEQYVQNTNTGNWCRFQGWNAHCFCLYNNRLYFGTDTGIVLADISDADGLPKSYSDDGNSILYSALPAYAKFGSPGLKSQLTSARVVMNVFDPKSISLNAFADYQVKPLPDVQDPNEQIQGQWDVSYWDTDYWAGDSNDPASTRARPVWRPVSAFGFAIAVSVRYRSVVQNVLWYSTTYIYNQGGIN